MSLFRRAHVLTCLILFTIGFAAGVPAFAQNEQPEHRGGEANLIVFLSPKSSACLMAFTWSLPKLQNIKMSGLSAWIRGRNVE